MRSPCDVTLQIVDVGIEYSVVADLCRTALRVVEEVQHVRALRHVRQLMAAPGVIVGRVHIAAGVGHGLAHAQAVGVVGQRSV